MDINMGGGSSSITMNGMSIQVRAGKVYVNGKRYIPAEGDTSVEDGTNLAPKEIKLDQDGRFVGDIYGDLHIHGSNVSLTVEGRIDGSVRSDGDVTVGDRVSGSATAGQDVHVGGKIGGSANAGRDILRR